MAPGTARNAGARNWFVAPAVELRGHLVPPGAPPGPPEIERHVIEAERQQHGLLQPLIDGPLAVVCTHGDAGLALVEQVQRLIDGIADFTLGRRR
jgi:hypothetical protein